MSARKPLIDNPDLKIYRQALGEYDTNVYILVCQRTGDSLIVDAPAEPEAIMNMVEDTRPLYLLLTHNHMDHTGALLEIKAMLDVPLLMHRDDALDIDVSPDIMAKHGETIRLGKLELTILHTPGHTPGGICIYTSGVLFAGDTLFPGGPGKTWSPDDFKTILSSITGALFSLPDDTAVLPGHGDMTTIGKCKEEYELWAGRPHNENLCGDVLWADS